jgi:type I restriction enzyme, S subunit
VRGRSGESGSLPVGWSRATLGAIGDYLNGRAFTKEEWSDVGRVIIRIQDLTGSSNSPNRFEGSVEPCHEVKRGDLLISWAATLGVYWWTGDDAVLNQHIFKVKSLVDQRFHFYLANHVIGELQRQTHGSGMVHITKSRFEATAVPVPPLTEQHRIVAAIEEHLSRVDAAIAGFKRAQALIPQYRASVLKAVYDGSLAEGLGVPFGSHALTLGDLLERIEAGKSFKCDERPPDNGEVGIVKVSAVTWGEFDDAESKTVQDPSRVDARYFIRQGDLLFSRANTIQLVGACVLVRTVKRRVMLSDKILRLVPKAGVSAKWLLLCLRSPQGRAAIERLSTGNQESMRNIGQDRIKQIPIPDVGPETIELVVGEVERRFSLLDAVTREAEASLARTARLRQSILKRAFEGKLVPQDPNDEPASVLLERILASRAMSPARSKRARQGA